MPEQIVVNASPLIFLSRSGHLDLLRVACDRAVVPEAVAGEIRARGDSDPTARALAQTEWLVVRAAPEIPPEILSWGLGPGESAVLATAQAEPGTVAVIDDLAGRRCAKSLDIPLRGTLGVVLLAKKKGKIASARTVLWRMRERGMYLSDRVLDAALELVGE